MNRCRQRAARCAIDKQTDMDVPLRLKGAAVLGSQSRLLYDMFFTSTSIHSSMKRGLLDTVKVSTVSTSSLSSSAQKVLSKAVPSPV